MHICLHIYSTIQNQYIFLAEALGVSSQLLERFSAYSR